MTIQPAKQAYKRWRDHVLKYYLEFIPAEKESAIARLIEEANERGCACADYENVWEGEIYNHRNLSESICLYLNAMGYHAECHKSPDVNSQRLTIRIRWDRPREDW